MQGEPLAHPLIGELEKTKDAFHMAVVRRQAVHLLERKTDQGLRSSSRGHCVALMAMHGL